MRAPSASIHDGSGAVGDRRPRRHATSRPGWAVSNSSRWLPANPAAPVTRVADKALTRNVSEGTAERREVAEAGQRERHEEAIVGRHDGRRRIVEPLVFEGNAAALRVVVAVDPLLG